MILLQNISLQYGDRRLFKDLSITLKQNDRIGLIGRNGAGKSTLIKIIAGELTPDQGSISIPKLYTIGVLKQTLDMSEDSTVLEEALKAFAELEIYQKKLETLNQTLSTRKDYESSSYMELVQEISDVTEKLSVLDEGTVEATATKILKGLGFKQAELHKKVKELSGGWKMRVEMAKLLLTKPSLLMLDEPTNHLDIESIIWLERYLKSYPGIVLVISHDTRFLDEVCNRTFEIEFGKINHFSGNYSKFVVEKIKQREINQSAFENQQKLIAEKERLIEKFRAKATKAKFAQSLIRELDRMDRVEVESEMGKDMNLRFPPAPRSGKVLFDLEQVKKQYDDQIVLNSVDLIIERGDKIAFVGQNGQGKSTLAKIIAGEIEASDGKVCEGHNVMISFFAQDEPDRLDPKLTVLDTLYAVIPEHMRTQARKILGSFLFSGEDVDKKVSVLSGGEKTRLALAGLITRDTNLLILDEPTNHLDIQAKAVLNQALDEYDGTLIVVSHDRDFLAEMTNKTYEFKDGELKLHVGDIESFLKTRKAEDFREIAKKSEIKSQQNNNEEKESESESLSREEIKKRQRRVQYLEKDIEKLESKIEAIEIEMSDPEFYHQPEKDQRIADYQKLKSELDQKLSDWEEAFENLD